MKRFGKKKRDKCNCCNNANACGGGFYFLGIIGSAIYYIQQSSIFGEGVVGVLKALVWPVFVVMKILGL